MLSLDISNRIYQLIFIYVRVLCAKLIYLKSVYSGNII